MLVWLLSKPSPSLACRWALPSAPTWSVLPASPSRLANPTPIPIVMAEPLQSLTPFKHCLGNKTTERVDTSLKNSHTAPRPAKNMCWASLPTLHRWLIWLEICTHLPLRCHLSHPDTASRAQMFSFANNFYCPHTLLFENNTNFKLSERK